MEIKLLAFRAQQEQTLTDASEGSGLAFTEVFSKYYKIFEKMFVFMPTELCQITNMHFDDD